MKSYKLHFEEIHYSALKNKKYLIHYQTNYIIKYVGTFVEYEVARKLLIGFQNVYCLYNKIPYMYFDTTSIFFEMIPQKEKIQNAMEKRALLKILRQVIGDETFLW